MNNRLKQNIDDRVWLVITSIVNGIPTNIDIDYIVGSEMGDYVEASFKRQLKEWKDGKSE